jgi:hypothetical protein
VKRGFAGPEEVGDSRNEAVVFDDIVERKTYGPSGRNLCGVALDNRPL